MKGNIKKTTKYMIIRNPSNIYINYDGKEQLEKELYDGGFVVNQGDINHYVTRKIEHHWHNELELFLLDNGEAEVELDGNKYIFHQGDGCFVNRNVLHSFTSKSQICTFRSFVFDSTLISGTVGSIFDLNYVSPLLNNGSSYIIFNSKDEEFIDNFELAFKACELEQIGYEFQLRYALSNIILLCNKRSKNQNKNMLLNERIKPMMVWIDQHLEEEISVQDIASIGNVCVRECQRIFEKYLNYSPMEYVRTKRIVKATQLLIQSDISIIELAHKYQFSSSSHFSKTFKEIVGCTPLAYRKQSVK